MGKKASKEAPPIAAKVKKVLNDTKDEVKKLPFTMAHKVLKHEPFDSTMDPSNQPRTPLVSGGGACGVDIDKLKEEEEEYPMSVINPLYKEEEDKGILTKGQKG